MSGEKKAKGWRFYGLVGFGAIALLSAGVWALQYAGSGPEKTLSPLVVHNNLQIDLNEPDLFLDSDSLSQLPKDLLTIPFLHDVLSEDFVFYYIIVNHADRLALKAFVVLSMNTIHAERCSFVTLRSACAGSAVAR